METFKTVKFALILGVIFFAKTAKATSVDFDFYNGESYAALCSVNDAMVENVKIVSKNSTRAKLVAQDTTGQKLNIDQNRIKFTLGGYVYNYNSKTKMGCLFTDLEMVTSQMVNDISDQLSNSCFSEKYGFGVHIYFGEIDPKNYYKKPIEGLLMNYYGTWEATNGNYVFHVQEIQPFF
ncbi:hypothetical protein K8089_11140 [Aequorivita sp. F47161]|uniref:Uncharacterized protein n=1 Tax=Aequorivita vitellina TaxID=2874475 RepID=A0A9X1QZS5_9FLAO|nr:hypothetical protein [Aequorivita vitellina]MCG2419579.1 hypothetical protein [Aequorivita vitellina]